MASPEAEWGLKGEPTWWCNKFGHRWHNHHSGRLVIVHGEPCIRSGCTVTRRNVPDHFELPDPGAMIDIPPAVATPTRSQMEAELRAMLADEIHRLRFDGGVGSVPDSYFWGITHAERIIRGDHL